MQVTSSAFGQHQAIPTKYTCDGENLSPPLAWSGVPAGAKSLVLIVDAVCKASEMVQNRSLNCKEKRNDSQGRCSSTNR